jgi:predicted ATPase
MALKRLHVRGYRSVRDLSLPLARVNIITGANGTGKSNLYQALMLVGRAAQGQFAKAVAEEGGTPSLLWAGGERIRYTRKKPAKRFELTVEDDRFAFSFAAGLPKPSSLPPGRSLFGADPEVKEEKLFLRDDDKSVLMLDRQGPSTSLRNAEGKMEEYALELLKIRIRSPAGCRATSLPRGEYGPPNIRRLALLSSIPDRQPLTSSLSPDRHTDKCVESRCVRSRSSPGNDSGDR